VDKIHIIREKSLKIDENKKISSIIHEKVLKIHKIC
jgi:hypothetical protein